MIGIVFYNGNLKTRNKNRRKQASQLARTFIAASTASLYLSMTACSGSKQSGCGSSPAAVLSRPNLKGTESGLLGGFIQLANGKECTVVLDVVAPGPLVVLNAWTSNHCKADLSKEKLSFTLKIFGNNGYYQATAWATEARIEESLYGLLDRTGTRKAFQTDFASKFYINSGQLPNDAQQDCVKKDFNGTFCATLADTTVYDLVIDPGLDPNLLDILSTAKAKRDEIRESASQVTGSARKAAELSQDLIEYWRNKKYFYFAPMVDLWLTCSSPELKKKFLADAEQRNRSFKSFNDALTGSPTTGSVFSSVAHGQNTDLSKTTFTTDTSIKLPSFESAGPVAQPDTLSSIFAKDGWQEQAMSFWGSVDVTAFIKSCDASSEILKQIKTSSLFSKTIWDDVNTAGLVQGDSVKAELGLQAYTKYVMKRETEIREKLLAAWPSLAQELVGSGSLDDIFVNTNVTLKPNGQKEGWQFSGFSMNADLFSNTSAEVLTSGVRFKRDSAAALTFKEGDSGSLFSYRGQFPLLTLNSVDGKGTSGGAAVVPSPVDPNQTPEQAAPDVRTRANTQAQPASAEDSQQNRRLPTSGQAGQNQSQPAAVQQNNQMPGASTGTSSDPNGGKTSPSAAAINIPQIPQSGSANSGSDKTQADADSTAPRDRTTAWSSTSAPIPGAETPSSYRTSEDSCY